jgi:hypothetical protein
MVRTIRLENLYEVSDKELLGTFPTERDFDEIIDEDCDVYLPDGTLGLTFRKRALSTVTSVTPDSATFDYWRWASRSLCSDQRGNAAGRDMFTNVEIRVTEGQKRFFTTAAKRELTLAEAQELAADRTPSRDTYYIHKTEADGLVDVEEIEKWAGLVRKLSTAPEVRTEAIAKRNAAKLAWFDNWLVNVWAVAEDKRKAAK